MYTPIFFIMQTNLSEMLIEESNKIANDFTRFN